MKFNSRDLIFKTIFLFVLFFAFSITGFCAVADISINADKAIRVLPNELFGQNMAVWEKTGDGSDPGYIDAVKAMQCAIVRFPGGSYADIVDWENIPQCKLSWVPVTMQKGIAFARACGIQMQIIVNYAGNWCDKDQGHDAAVKKAADWVKYMNVTNGGAYPVKYWEIGNETFGSGESGFWSDDEEGGTRYGNYFVDFYKAMKKVDPKIQIGAQCQFDHAGFTKGELEALKAKKVVPDFFIIHVYTIWLTDRLKGMSWDSTLYASNPVLDARIMDNVAQGISITTQTDQLVEKYFGKKYVGKIPYWCTEWRSILDYKFDEFVDTMFSAQFLLEMGRLGWQGANIWDLKNGFDVKKGCDFGLLRTGVNKDVADDNPIDSPRPTYYIFPYLSRVFGRQMVECTAPAYVPNAVPGKYPVDWNLNTVTGNRIRAWASKDASGNLTIFVANNDSNNSATANITINGFNADKQGKIWLFEPSGNTYYGSDKPVLQRTHLKINGSEDPSISSLPGDGKTIDTGNVFKVDLPAASMALIKVPAAPVPTPASAPESVTKPAK